MKALAIIDFVYFPNPLYDPPGSTFEPTQREKNVESINTIPGKDILYYDCRILPDTTLESVKKTIRNYADAVEKETGTAIP